MVQKKVDKQSSKKTKKKKRPISLLLICGKIFERLIYNKMLEYSIENDLVFHNHSGFKHGDSYINHLLSITHEIYKSCDESYETIGLFLDISAASHPDPK